MSEGGVALVARRSSVAGRARGAIVAAHTRVGTAPRSAARRKREAVVRYTHRRIRGSHMRERGGASGAVTPHVAYVAVATGTASEADETRRAREIAIVGVSAAARSALISSLSDAIVGDAAARRNCALVRVVGSTEGAILPSVAVLAVDARICGCRCVTRPIHACSAVSHAGSISSRGRRVVARAPRTRSPGVASGTRGASVVASARARVRAALRGAVGWKTETLVRNASQWRRGARVCVRHVARGTTSPRIAHITVEARRSSVAEFAGGACKGVLPSICAAVRRTVARRELAVVKDTGRCISGPHMRVAGRALSAVCSSVARLAVFTRVDVRCLITFTVLTRSAVNHAGSINRHRSLVVGRALRTGNPRVTRDTRRTRVIRHSRVHTCSQSTVISGSSHAVIHDACG